MSEPPTKGKVVLHTTIGDIDIELWPKEAPKAVRNFVQLCIEGYYDDCLFHRVVKDFIVQTGDPTNTGEGGESIYDSKTFSDEFHSRLRFNHRGIVAMANEGTVHSNRSQFFITLDRADELDRKNTIFGKVVGDTIYNVMKMNNLEVDKKNDRPKYPAKIINTEVLYNPFEDIVPRDVKREKKKEGEEEEVKVKGTKNKSLLSFGDEVEEEEGGEGDGEEDRTKENEKKEKEKKEKEKMLSRHHFSEDPKIKKEIEEQERKLAEERARLLEQQKEKEKEKEGLGKQKEIEKEKEKAKSSSSVKDFEQQMREEAQRRSKRIVEASKTEEKKEKKEGQREPEEEEEEGGKKKKKRKTEGESEDLNAKALLAEFHSKYQKGTRRKKGDTERERKSLDKLLAFQKTLRSLPHSTSSGDSSKGKEKAEEEEEKVEEKGKNTMKKEETLLGLIDEPQEQEKDWLTHRLTFEKSLARDPTAHQKENDGYTVVDPRADRKQNPLNKHQQHMHKLTAQKKKENW